MMAGSIKGKLTLVGMVSTGAAVVLLGLSMALFDWIDFRRAIVNRLRVQAVAVSDSCGAALTFGDAAAAAEALETLRMSPGVRRVVLFGKDDRVFARFAPDGLGAGGDPPARGRAETAELGRAEVWEPVLFRGQRLGTVYIRSDAVELKERLQQYGLVIAAATMLSFAVALALLAGLQRRITRPLAALAELTRRIAQTRDYAPRAKAESADEIGVLADGLNGMLDAIQQRDAELTRHRQSLEGEVTARTGELKEANLRLSSELAERLKAERALTTAAQEWRTTFDATSQGVCLLDAERRIVRCNLAFSRMCGAPFDGLIGHPLEEAERAGLGVEIRPLLDRIRSSGQREGGVLAASGRRLFEAAFDPIQTSGGALPGGLVHTLAEVTDRRRLEEQLNQAQKMEAIGRLAGGVAHDFNNLLSVILGYAPMLQAKLPADSPLRGIAQEITNAGERAAALTRQLLAFSRKQVVNPVPLRVDQVIGDLAKMMRRLIGEHIELNVKISAGIGQVFMDASQLEQVLINLVVNARDAMSGGGTLVIEARNVELTEATAKRDAGVRPGDWVVIGVQDSGEGMSEETLKNIFEPFFTTKPQGQGTGLGLAMVYGAVTQSGGGLQVHSRPGEGSRFDIYLPRVEAPTPVLSRTAPREYPRGKGESILLVEDDDQLRQAMRRILDEGGYAVVEARDGESALAKLRAGTAVRLVLTDIVMPGMGGLALGKELLRERPEVPVLYMSGYSEEVLLGKELPPRRLILPKPIDLMALFTRLKALFEEADDDLDGLPRAAV